MNKTILIMIAVYGVIYYAIAFLTFDMNWWWNAITNSKIPGLSIVSRSLTLFSIVPVIGLSNLIKKEYHL